MAARGPLGPARHSAAQKYGEVYDRVTFRPQKYPDGVAMPGTFAYRCIILPIAVAMFFAAAAAAQQSTSQLGNVLGARERPGNNGFDAVIETANVDVYLQQQNGAPIEGVAVVSLLNLAGQVYRQVTTKEGHLTFNDVAATEYTIQVVSPVYERAVKQVQAPSNASARVTIVMRPGEGVDVGAALSLSALKPKAQKEVAKAMEALRANKPTVARSHLDAVNRMAPNQPEVSYLFGVYASQTGDETQAKSYWTKTLEQNPRHFRALLSLSEISMREKKAAEAVDYLNRAAEAEPSSWRPHAILAQAYYMQHSRDEAIKQAERALELGRGQAVVVEPLLAQCLAQRGERDRAISILKTYVQERPADSSAKKQLESLQNPQRLVASPDAPISTNEIDPSAVTAEAEALPVPSNWLPPDIDDKMPPVEPGAACALNEVVQNAGKRLEELVKNVDRFTATELVTDESINRLGLPAGSEKAQFDYIVSMEETRRGALTVEEYRERRTSSKDFPEAVMTSGLPAMVVIFHPYYAGNFEMTCEGLGRWNGRLVWQVHFRQRKDKPSTIRSYRMGPQGQGYPVALKGRAWIAADSYQIVRLETNMVAPMPQIRLAAEHVSIEYAPVNFRQGAMQMWLPASAEIYYDWKGHRVHRQHQFSNYLLFSVDDKQKISAPKDQDRAPADQQKPN